MAFDNFDVDELMASLEASSTTGYTVESRTILHPSMALDDGANLDDLLLQAEGTVPVKTIPDLEVEAPQAVQTRKAKLSRTVSKTGRPEEIFGTIKKKNAKGATTMQVGNYQLGAKLGKGAFGAVYKGLDLKTGQFVAIKRIGLDRIDGDQMMKEINFLKNFHHKNIVQYIGLVQTDRHMNLVLEFIDSGSLAQVLANYGFFPESLAAIYVSQVLEGLIYLHSQNIIHRDIKGGNLLITREGSIKLADFGIATVATTQRHSLVEGSPYWMAPELITLSHTPTTASDIWSVGCTLIELLTGVPPYFDMVAVSAIYKMVNDGCPPLPDDISESAEDFLRQCFVEDPDQRLTAEQLRAHPWILEFVDPYQGTPSGEKKENLLDVDAVRNTVKQFTLSKESGAQMRRELAHMEAAETQSDPHPITDDGPDEDDSPNEAESAQTDSKKEKKAKRKMSGTPESKSDRKGRQRKSTLGKFRGKKKKDAATSQDAIIPSSDSSLMVVNIYAVETRRSIFTYTVYKIKVMQDARVWDIERTWSDFKEMHTKLELKFGPDDLPSISPRRFWGALESDFVRKRWQELQHYLLELMKSEEIRNGEIFLNFLTSK